MNHRIENCYVASYDMFVEFARKYAVGPRPWTYWLTPLVLLIWIVLGEDSMVNIWCCALFLMQLLMPDIYAAVAVYGSKKNNGGVLPETVVTFGEDIQMFEGPVHLTFPYEKVKKVVCLKHSYVLLLGKRNGILLDPKGFSQGSWEDLTALLREKKPEIQIPVK